MVIKLNSIQYAGTYVGLHIPTCKKQMQRAIPLTQPVRFSKYQDKTSAQLSPYWLPVICKCKYNLLSLSRDSFIYPPIIYLQYKSTKIILFKSHFVSKRKFVHMEIKRD